MNDAQAPDSNPSLFQRIWRNVMLFGEAMEMSEAEFVQRRLNKVEAELRDLRQELKK